MSLLPAFISNAEKYKVSGYVITRGATPPVSDIDTIPPSGINQINRQVIEFLLHNREVKTVFLVATWPKYLNGAMGKFSTKDSTKHDHSDTLNALECGIDKTIQTLRENKIKVIFVEDVPTLNHDPVRLFYVKRHFAKFGYFTDQIPDISQDEATLMSKYHRFNEIVKSSGSEILDPGKLIRNSGKLSLFSIGKLVYTDDNHLSVDGSNYVSPTLNTIFSRIEPQSPSLR